MKKSNLLSTLAAGAVLAFSSVASAHVWNIGWKANNDGSLTMLGTSYHTGSVGGAGSVDDFTVNPAGFIINGTNVSFETGSVVNLNDCNGPGFANTSVTTTCAPTLNAFGLDAGVQSTENFVNPSYIYGKYATVTLDSTQLAGLGIGQGNNSVSLSTYANNIHWDGLNFDTGNIPLQVVITIPPTTGVPEPGSIALLGLGLAGLGLSRKKAKAKTAA